MINLLALWSIGELVQNMVQHCRQPVSQLGSKEWCLDIIGQVVEHVHCLTCQGQVRSTLSLILI